MQEQTKSKNGNSDGNQTDAVSTKIPEKQAQNVETERATDGKENVRSEISVETFNAKQAAAYLKKDEKTIRNWIKSGRLSGQKVGGSWQVTKANLDAAFVEEIRNKGRETEQEKEDVRPLKNLENKKKTDVVEQETEQEKEDPTPVRPDTRYSQLEIQIKDQERLLTEKDQRIIEMKSAQEKQLTEKDQRINEKSDRINDLKGDREKDKELYNGLLNNAQQLIQSLQSQVVQLEAPKQPIKSSVETVEGNFQESVDRGAQAKSEQQEQSASESDTAEQRAGESGKKKHRRWYWPFWRF